MNRGYIILAQNNGQTDYIKCARALCRSIKNVMPAEHVTLLTDIPVKNGDFDNIAIFPYGDKCVGDGWKLANDWQVYWGSPYEHTIKLEADMYLPRAIDWWWDAIKHRDLVISTTIRDYCNRVSGARHYRKIWDKNKLPDVYNGLVYFKKSEIAQKFYFWVKHIFENWGDYQALLIDGGREKATTDLVYAIAAKIIGVENATLPKFTDMSFIHMKQAVIGGNTDVWYDELIYEISKTCIRIGTIPQLYPLHYHNKKFASKIMECYDQ